MWSFLPKIQWKYSVYCKSGIFCNKQTSIFLAGAGAAEVRGDAIGLVPVDAPKDLFNNCFSLAGFSVSEVDKETRVLAGAPTGDSPLDSSFGLGAAAEGFGAADTGFGAVLKWFYVH